MSNRLKFLWLTDQLIRDLTENFIGVSKSLKGFCQKLLQIELILLKI